MAAAPMTGVEVLQQAVDASALETAPHADCALDHLHSSGMWTSGG